jgi:hypothetical protein
VWLSIEVARHIAQRVAERDPHPLTTTRAPP